MGRRQSDQLAAHKIFGLAKLAITHTKTEIISKMDHENDCCAKVYTEPSDISYVHGACKIPLLNHTVADRLRLAVKNVPDRTMAIFDDTGIRKTYQQVFNDARQFAASLLHLNVKKGDRIGIWAPNCYEWIIAKYAAAFAGLTIVGINFEYKADELQYVLQKVGVSVIVSPEKDHINDYYRILCEILPEILENGKNGDGKIESKNFPALKNIILFGTDDKKIQGGWNFDEILKFPTIDDYKLLDIYEKQIQVDDPFDIIFTSGTTGRPKATTLSHHNLINNAYFLGFRAGFQPSHEILIVTLNLFGCGTFVFGSLLSLCHQQTIIFADAKNVLKAVRDEKLTLLYGTPKLLIDFLNSPERETTDFSRIRGGIIGAAGTPDVLFQQAIQHLGLQRYVNTYGSTETMMTTASYPDDNKNIVKPMYVMPHMEIGIINKINGKFVPREEKGEIVIRGYSVMQGYWDDEEKTKQVLGKDRWYHTGDIGLMNSDGSVEIVGRYKDMVIKGGVNFFPAEIEQYIFQHPSIAECCIVGVPDEKMGEELCAWIRLKPSAVLSEKELIEFLKNRISRTKIPRYFLFKSQDEFPLTPSGKIKKYEIQEITIKELNLENVTSYCGE